MNMVLDHKQRRWFVVEVLTGVDTNLFTPLATTRTDAFGLGQFVVDRHTRQLRRQTAAAMRPAFPLRLVRAGQLAWCRRVLGRGGVREQQGLVGIKAFPTRPVQTLQQQVEAMLQRRLVALVLLHGGQQLQDHALEGAGVVRQLLGSERGGQQWQKEEGSWPLDVL
jgi:hypothetical protein